MPGGLNVSEEIDETPWNHVRLVEYRLIVYLRLHFKMQDQYVCIHFSVFSEMQGIVTFKASVEDIIQNDHLA